MTLLPNIDPENRRRALMAATALFAVLAAHTVLEVARDALFLARLPPEQLPFAYIAIAGAAWVAAQVDRRLLKRFDERRVSMLTLFVSAAGTGVFYLLFDGDAWWVPHAFYVWIGLVATFAITQFWRLLANVFTVGEAKRLYAPIAAGGSLGAVAGASMARGLHGLMEDRALLLVGLSVLVVAGLLIGLTLPQEAAMEAPRRRGVATDVESAEDPVGVRYVRLLLVLVALTSVVAILVDYLFKTAVAEALPAGDLAGFFATYSVVVNVISLLVQIAIAPRLLALLGAQRALVVLPLLLALGAVGTLVAGGLWSASLLRGTDGALRHSLHRSAVELLYLPLTRAMRDKYKALIDALGQRGGQALGSVGILAATSLSLGTEAMAVSVAVLASAWAAVAFLLRAHYLDLFRANLRAGTVETRVEVPELDLGSLESMMSSLNSGWNEEVLATLDLLEEYGRAKVIPALILYHPSREVVLRALEIFAAADRTDFAPVARRLLDSKDDEVAAATMLALATALDRDELRYELVVQRRPTLRAAVLVRIVSSGLDQDRAAAQEIEQCALAEEPRVRLALARAIRLEGDAERAPILLRMAESLERRPPSDHTQHRLLVRELILAFGRLRHAPAIPWLLQKVGSRDTRAAARDALVEIGAPALDAVLEALLDASLPRATRVHLPRTVSRFVHPRAASALFERLQHEDDGWVRYKCLRGLGGLGSSLPALSLDARAIEELVRRELARAAVLLDERIALVRAQEDDPARLTMAGEMLAPVLAEKESQALDRAVRIVGLSRPEEDLRRLSRGLKSPDKRRRAESRELLVAGAPIGLSLALEALLDDVADRLRLDRARQALGLSEPPVEYAELVRRMIEDESEAVRLIAAHHAGELGLEVLRAPLEAAQERAKGLSVEVIEKALASLQGVAGVPT
ncbi:MAG: hypothetical protein AB8I08_04235 [Sandaracinaceae bacterium]